jgi:hypothetical protein
MDEPQWRRVQTEKYQKKGNLQRTIPDLSRYVSADDMMSVVIFSSGAVGVVGAGHMSVPGCLVPERERPPPAGMHVPPSSSPLPDSLVVGPSRPLLKPGKVLRSWQPGSWYLAAQRCSLPLVYIPPFLCMVGELATVGGWSERAL